MDSNFFYKRSLFYFLFSIIIILFIGCSGKEKSNLTNTYYLEIINFDDSLKKEISEKIIGKASFYKKDKLEILSVNYINEDYKDIHYFKSVKDLNKNIITDTKKIKIEFRGDYSVDSIRYSLQKFKYTNNEWIKISDMGFLKGTTTYKKAKEFAISEFSKQIVNNIVQYSYN